MKKFFTLVLFFTLCTANAADERQPDLSGVTDRGMSIEVYSQLSPLTINQIHSWHIRVKDRDENIVVLDRLDVFGGMPEHDHGLPTQPQVTAQLDNGDYLLEGVRFHMQGQWQLQIELIHEGVGDTAVIDFILQ